jgi:hypothetical protein
MNPIPEDRGGWLGLAGKNLVKFAHGAGFEFKLTKSRHSSRVRRQLVRRSSERHAYSEAPVEAAAGRYFTVEVEARPGINHLRFALELLVREALSLGRVPVAFRPRFDPRHNAGRDLVTDWDRYIDMRRVEVTDRRTQGVTEVAVLTRAQIEPLDPLSALWVERPHPVVLGENRGYDLLARHNRTGLDVQGIHDGPAGLPHHAVKFRPSETVTRLAQAVRQQLGHYCAVHVRRDDMLEMKDEYPNLDRDTRPDRIGQTLGAHLQDGAIVYIMTNERDRSFFLPLKKRFRVLQHFDFPPLRELVDGDRPDNFLLFEVEKQLFEHAAVKVHTFTHPEGGARIALCSDRGWA